MNNTNIPPELNALWGSKLVEAVASLPHPLPPETLAALLQQLQGAELVGAGHRWAGLTAELLAPHLARLKGWNLVCAGQHWPGMTGELLAPHLSRLQGWDLLKAGELWPGLTGEILVPHLGRLDDIYLIQALDKWPDLKGHDLSKCFERLSDFDIVMVGKCSCVKPNDLRQHIPRLRSHEISLALNTWNADILSELREELEAHLAAKQLMGE